MGVALILFGNLWMIRRKTSTGSPAGVSMSAYFLRVFRKPKARKV
jgi:hypothetical protein